MKRKLNFKAKTAINIFIALIVLIVLIFSFSIYKVVSETTISKELSSNAICYDVRNSIIPLNSQAKVERRWDNKFEIKIGDSKYDLGEHNVIKNDNKLTILGGGYQVFEDGSALKLDTITEVEFANYDQFFKLGDLKYLIVAKNIKTSDNSFETDGYLYIELDRSGYARVSNDVISTKLTKSHILVTDTIKFDVANELLEFGKLSLNLVNILGSTNEYGLFEDHDYQYYKEDNKETIDLLIKGGDGGKGGKGGQGGAGGAGGAGGIGGTGGEGGSGGTGGSSTIVARTAFFIKDYEMTGNSIKIYYNCVDPYGDLGSLHALVTTNKDRTDFVMDDNGKPLIINLSPDATDFTIEGLTPSTKYYITLVNDNKGGNIDEYPMSNIDNPLYEINDSISLVTKSSTNYITLLGITDISDDNPSRNQILDFNIQINESLDRNKNYYLMLYNKVGKDYIALSQYRDSIDLGKAYKASGDILSIEYSLTASDSKPLLYAFIVEDTGGGTYKILDGAQCIIYNTFKN